MISVLYDGARPLCAREIAMYRRQQGGCHPLVDVSQIPEGDIPLGLSRQAVLARFHVISRDGSAVGAAGFVEPWKAIPKLHLVGRLASLPPVLSIFELGYSLFLRVRPTSKTRAHPISCRMNAASSLPPHVLTGTSH